MCGGAPTPPSVIANRLGVDANTLIPSWIEEPWNPYRAADREQAEKQRKRLIKLICKIKGEEFNEEKKAGNYKVTVGDIRMVMERVANIDLDLKLEE